MRRAAAPAALLAAALLSLACSGGPVKPGPLDTRNEACAWCRMAVSDARFAAQLAAPGEEPRFFDDVGCLRDYLAAAREPLSRWTAFVADHRTKEWAPAASAVYTRVDGLATPMSSHVVAHAAPSSRDADPDAKGGTPLAAAELFAPKGLPAGGRRP